MLNMKKIVMVVTASILGLGLTGCGKDNYNGSYSGTEIKMPQSQTGQTGQTQNYYPQQNYYQQQSYRGVTAELSHDGEIVTGTYTITQQANQYGYQQPGMTNTSGTGVTETYRFEANASGSDTLTAVRLIPMTSGYGGSACVLEGSLAVVQDGRRLSGTLNPTQAGGQTYYQTNCAPTQITLDRAK